MSFLPPQSFSSEAPTVLRRARVPLPFLAKGAPTDAASDHESAVLVDIALEDGRVKAVAAADTLGQDGSVVALDGRHVWPTLIDVHAHLDKGHIVDRTPNPTGGFAGARDATSADRKAHWTQDDVIRRMNFGLRCAEAHGVAAIRTHLDSHEGQGDTSWEAFREVREAWKGRVSLQAVSLVPLDVYRTDYAAHLCDVVAASGGIVGGVTRASGGDHDAALADLDDLLDRLFLLARERNLDVDLHVDETGETSTAALPRVAMAALRHNYAGRVTCGHCCSLSLQDEETTTATIALAAEAGLNIITLPTVNMYLQDRQAGRTPRWRGVTPVLELRQAGVRVAVAGDNCRDPFYAYGDHDMLDTFRQAVRILHLDHPFADATAMAGPVPAAIMGLTDRGSIRAGAPADLILTDARSMDQLIARPQSDRILLKAGQRSEATLPRYDELES